jgi:UDP-N-acetylglucosamine--N-acetylmuramyl-(pentapeptide) pyrophosphoryl-undecaprenol N-acetylglucosamine transferase
MRDFVRGSAGVLEEWQLLHITGTNDQSALVHTYAAAGIDAVVLPFLDQIGLAWGAAELAISRAGANSVAESAANNVPTIFVPFPWHNDLHQRYNVADLVRSGGAVLALDAIDPAANLHAIGEPLRELLLDPTARAAMRAILEERVVSDGAREIADLLLEVALNPA